MRALPSKLDVDDDGDGDGGDSDNDDEGDDDNDDDRNDDQPRCAHCLPDCESTIYTSSVSATPLRRSMNSHDDDYDVDGSDEADKADEAGDDDDDDYDYDDAKAKYTQVLCRQLLFVGQSTINSHDDDDNADDDDDDKYQV